MRVGRLVMLALVASTGIAAGQRHGVISAFDTLEPGQWALRDTSGVEPLRHVCLGDGIQMIQIHHGEAACSRLVLNDERSGGTVSYSCPGLGHGQTAVSVETSRLFHLHTSGLANGAPFDVDYEARLVGHCGR